VRRHRENQGERYPLLTRDPITNEELIVTRLENRARGLVLEAEFSLGWVGKLTPEQLEFAGLLLRYRGNVQKLATELGVAYNTARSRLDAIVEALGGTPEETQPRHDSVPPSPDRSPPDRAAELQQTVLRQTVLQQLERGEVSFEDAMRMLKG
jgi:hypothetical protein